MALTVFRATSSVAPRHARCAAAAAGVGVAAHLLMAGAGGLMAGAGGLMAGAGGPMAGAGGLMAVIAVVMAMACSPCAWGMWRSPSARSARVLVGMSLGMALLHGALLLGAAPALGHSHGAAASSSAVPAAASTGHDLSLLAVMGADFTAAMLAASWIRRSSTLARRR